MLQQQPLIELLSCRSYQALDQTSNRLFRICKAKADNLSWLLKFNDLPKRLQTRFAMALAIVLKGAGHVFKRMPVSTGMQKPPQKNQNHRRVEDMQKFDVKAIGKPKHPPATIMKTAVGKAFGLLQPPIFVNSHPPITTPRTGPVREMAAKQMKAYYFDIPMTALKQSVIQNCTPVVTKYMPVRESKRTMKLQLVTRQHTFWPRVQLTTCFSSFLICLSSFFLYLTVSYESALCL